MKLLRYGERGSEKPAIVDSDGNVRSLAGTLKTETGDVVQFGDFQGPYLSQESLSLLKTVDLSILPIVAKEERIGPCVSQVGKVVGVGLNYKDHANEAGMAIPQEPILFLKASSSICGPYDDVLLPRDSKKLDWEVELGVVIGTKATYVSESEALNHVAGFCVVNDFSERGYQLDGGGQWSKGKSFDNFCPIGPWLVTRDEIVDPQELDLSLAVNQLVKQDGTSANMIFSVAMLISYISGYMTLHPGDIIATGTPAGVGLGMKPPQFLKAGDLVQLSIDGLGTQSHLVKA